MGAWDGSVSADHRATNTKNMSNDLLADQSLPLGTRPTFMLPLSVVTIPPLSENRCVGKIKNQLTPPHSLTLAHLSSSNNVMSYPQPHIYKHLHSPSADDVTPYQYSDCKVEFIVELHVLELLEYM